MSVLKNKLKWLQDRQKMAKVFLDKNKKIILYIKLVGSVFFLAYILSRLNFVALEEIFKHIDYLYLFLALALTFVVSLIYNLRYYYILLKEKSNPGFLNLYLINRFSNLINFILPGGLGQELGRLAYLKKKKVAVFSSVIDRVLGLLSLALVGVLGLIFSQKYLFPAILGFLILVAIIIVFAIQIKKRTHYSIYRPLLLSIIYSLGLVLIAFFELKAVDSLVLFSELLIFVPLVSIALMLPISINGYGLREYLWVIMLGLPIETAVSYGLVGYIIGFLLSLPGLILVFDKRTIVSNKFHN